MLNDLTSNAFMNKNNIDSLVTPLNLFNRLTVNVLQLHVRHHTKGKHVHVSAADFIISTFLKVDSFSVSQDTGNGAKTDTTVAHDVSKFLPCNLFYCSNISANMSIEKSQR